MTWSRSLAGLLILLPLCAALPLSAAGCPLQLDCTSFRRAFADPRVGETSPQLGVLGGTLLVVLRNTGAEPVTVTGFTLGGEGPAALYPGQRLNWWRVWPNPVPSGGRAALTINARRAALREGRTVEVQVNSNAGSVGGAVKLTTSPVRIGHVVFEGLAPAPQSNVTIYLRNDDPRRTWRVDRLWLDGEPVTGRAKILGRDLRPGALAIASFAARPALAAGRPVVVRAAFSAGRQAAEVAAALRAFEYDFPIGTWHSAAWQQPEELAFLREAGIDHNIGYIPAAEAIKAAAEQYGIRAVVDAGAGNDMRADFIKANQGNQAITAWLRGDEPDTPRPNPDPSVPRVARTAAEVTPFWAIDDRHPVYDNYCRDRTFAEYGPIPDITSMDAYRVGAPMPDEPGAPHLWGTWLELAGTYTHDLKWNSEPTQMWVWSQGIATWTERLYVDGALGRPVPTPSECKVQLYQHLGRGAKGIWWFCYFRPEGRVRQDYRKDIAEEAPLLLPRFEQVADQVVAFFEETAAAIAGYNRQLRMLRPLLLKSDPARLAAITAGSNIPQLDAATLAGERAVIVIVTNLDYEMDPLGYRFAPQRNVAVAVTLPPWLTARDAFELTPVGPAPCTWRTGHGAVTLEAPELVDGAVYVIAGDKRLRKEMAAAR